jgi:catechol 2,3-dioxygenase-like lactoylglutathione lyase family enzyme
MVDLVDMNKDKDKDKGNILSTKEVMATIAVKDIDVARQFYEGTLGLTLTASDMPCLLTFNNGKVLVYQSLYAGTNQATSATWNVGDDIERIVDTLKSKGVVFEHYDMPDATRGGDIHVTGKMKAAWFKDPDGNILNLAGH